MDLNFKIDRKGRAWTGAEVTERSEALVEQRLEIRQGRLFNDDVIREQFLGMILENLGMDTALSLGSMDDWVEALLEAHPDSVKLAARVLRSLTMDQAREALRRAALPPSDADELEEAPRPLALAEIRFTSRTEYYEELQRSDLEPRVRVTQVVRQTGAPHGHLLVVVGAMARVAGARTLLTFSSFCGEDWGDGFEVSKTTRARAQQVYEEIVRAVQELGLEVGNGMYQPPARVV